ncbi:MAG: hypothetical protein N2512_08965 [Armatimonadetes bacterium]|nr:hypothetical protein [Armatimonadota bacterium]
MPTKYWDYANGNDTTGNGSPSNPYKTLYKASLEAGVGSEVRCAGQPLVSLGTATWTQGSTTVTFQSAPPLSVGDYIRPNLSDCPAYRVSGVTGTTVTLAWAWRGPSGSYTTSKIPLYVLSEKQITGADNQAFTFGWRLSDESQPADYVSAFKIPSGGGFHGFEVAHSGVWRCNGRFLVLGHGAANNGVFIQTPVKVHLQGLLDLTDWSYGMFVNRSVNTAQAVVYADKITCAYNARVVAVSNSTLFCREVIVHNNLGGTQILGTSGLVWCHRLTALGGANNPVSMTGPGAAAVGTLDWQRSDVAPQIVVKNGAVVTVGYLSSPVAPSLSSESTVIIGGPATRWCYKHGETGIADKVTGRGGTGYGLRIDSTNHVVPFMLPFQFTVSAGTPITLSCYAYYTGTQGAPEVWWDLLDGQGSYVGRKYISLPQGTGWSDAQQLSVTFDELPAQTGMAVALLCVRDSGGDAISYFDDFSLSTGAGDLNTLSLDTHGAELLLQKAATGGAVAFPLGL